MKRIFVLTALLIAQVGLAAAQNVLLLYDNIGEPYFTDNVTRAGRALGEASGDDLRVVVYHKREKGGNIIYELVRDARAKNGFRKNTLKTYAADQNDSFSGATLTAVVGDMRGLVPGSNYGFAFGSHGMGWIPKSVTIDGEANSENVSRNITSFDIYDNGFVNQSRFFQSLWCNRTANVSVQNSTMAAVGSDAFDTSDSGRKYSIFSGLKKAPLVRRSKPSGRDGRNG